MGKPVYLMYVMREGTEPANQHDLSVNNLLECPRCFKEAMCGMYTSTSMRSYFDDSITERLYEWRVGSRSLLYVKHCEPS